MSITPKLTASSGFSFSKIIVTTSVTDAFWSENTNAENYDCKHAYVLILVTA